MISIPRTAVGLVTVTFALSLVGCTNNPALPQQAASPAPTQRVTSFGTISGLDRSATTGVYAWLGIPYAKPPVGTLRWMPPVDPAPGRRARRATVRARLRARRRVLRPRAE
nr:carboxylesterase family protein [Burkholderia cepacia]